MCAQNTYTYDQFYFYLEAENLVALIILVKVRNIKIMPALVKFYDGEISEN